MNWEPNDEEMQLLHLITGKIGAFRMVCYPPNHPELAAIRRLHARISEVAGRGLLEVGPGHWPAQGQGPNGGEVV
ncbi:MAG: hypothetical protein AAGM22_23690 [Acidobacteriota bacterium]